MEKANWMYRKKLRIKIQCFHMDLKPFLSNVNQVQS